MNPPILSQFANPDPNAAPLNITQLVQLLNVLISSEIQGSYIPYVLQNGTPGMDDTDKAWIELDTAGRPKAVKIYYDGNWRRVYNGMLGEVRGYHGDPSNDFDDNGLGKVGLEYDGWHLCNGKDGTPDLSDKFLIAGHMNNSNGHTGYNNGWQTFVDGKSDKKTGGHATITLDEAHTYRPATPGVKMDRYSATGNTNDSGGILYGVNSVQHIDILPPDPGNTTPGEIDILNPFIALGWIIFVGYS